MQSFSVNQNTFYPISSTNIIDKLPVGVYKIVIPQMAPAYLYKEMDSFTFNYKLYDVKKSLVDRVHKTYHNTTGNLGVLLNGVKGTGKSVTAKLICNKLNLPVILIDNSSPMYLEFINSIKCDVVVFVDEFEKVYDTKEKEDSRLLSYMDGAKACDYRRVFVLTSNHKYINENLLQRPGRLRYLVEYGDLSKEVITEIVDDLLVHTSLRDVCIEFISKLDIITIDIVKAVLNEVNIHNENPTEFEDIFNVQKGEHDVYNVYELNEKSEILLRLNVPIGILDGSSITDLNEEDIRGMIGDNVYFGGMYVGELISIQHDNMVCQKQGLQRKFRIEKIEYKHHSFAF